MVVWTRNDYIQDAETQLDDKEIHEEVSKDLQTFIHTIHRVVVKIRKRGNLSADNIKYFTVRDHKFVQFYLLPKIKQKILLAYNLIFQMTRVCQLYKKDCN